MYCRLKLNYARSIRVMICDCIVIDWVHLLGDDCKDGSSVPAVIVSSDNDKECIMGLNSVVLGGGGSALDNGVVAAGIVGS